jgi:hypothetical protein
VTASLNGWAQITSSASPSLRAILIPGTHHTINVRRECAPVFAAALAQVNLHVIALDAGPVDGWVNRQARTGAGLSNHASGTAVDFRYDVLKADHKRHMTGAQITAMHAILAHFVTSKGKRIFGWGGDWKVGTFCDEMHLEIGQDWEPGVGSFVSAVDVVDVQKRLRIDANGNIAKPVVVPKPAPAPKVPAFPGNFHVGAHGPYVKALQKGLVGLHYRLAVDGQFGPQTKAAVVDYQRRHHQKQTGIVTAALYKTVAR